MDYDELVQKNIAGEISDLEFLLALWEELATKPIKKRWLPSSKRQTTKRPENGCLITRTEIYTNKSWIQQVIKHYSVSPN